MIEGVEADSGIPQPEKEKSLNWRESFSKAWESRIGKKVTSLVALTALSLGPTAEIKGGPLQLRKHSEVMPIVLSLPSGTIFRFTDLGEFKPDTSIPHINPNEEINKFINARDASLSELGLTPSKIENPQEFQKWILKQSSREDIRTAVGIRSINAASPDQLIKLSSAIVSANFQYTNFRDMTGEEMDVLYSELKRTDSTPIDVVLKHGEDFKVACYEYAAANVAVFDQIKQMPQFREKLQNVYLTAQNSETVPEKSKFGHSWYAAVFVSAPDRADVTYFDPTADDPDWVTPADVYGKDFFNTTTLTRSLREQGVLSDPLFLERIIDSVRSGEIGANELKDMLYDMSDKAEVSVARTKLLEEYVSHPISERERKDAENQLFDLYINPANVERTEDWHDRAKKLGQKLISEEKDLTAKRMEQYVKLPTTQEEYEKRYAPHIVRDSAFKDPNIKLPWWKE